MSYSKFKFFFSSDEEGTFWPGVVELPVDNEVSSVEPGNDENKNQRIITGVILFAILSLFFISKLRFIHIYQKRSYKKNIKELIQGVE